MAVGVQVTRVHGLPAATCALSGSATTAASSAICRPHRPSVLQHTPERTTRVRAPTNRKAMASRPNCWPGRPSTQSGHGQVGLLDRSSQQQLPALRRQSRQHPFGLAHRWGSTNDLSTAVHDHALKTRDLIRPQAIRTRGLRDVDLDRPTRELLRPCSLGPPVL